MSRSSQASARATLVDRITSAATTVPSIGGIAELTIEPRICGIYFLVSGEEVVYIGQSVDVVARVNAHIDEGEKRFDRVFYLSCPIGLLDHYEKHLIAAMKPRYNRERKRVGTAEFVARELIAHPEGLTQDELLERAVRYGIWAQTRRSLEANIARVLKRHEHIVFSVEDGRFRWTGGTESEAKSNNGLSSQILA